MVPLIGHRTFAVRYVVPIVLCQLLAIGSLFVGRDTLYLRDVLNTHLTGETAITVAAGSTPPTLDMSRAGGQPSSGNPNYLPFYPTRLLYSLVSPLTALNAHFWLHFLLMPWCFFLLARVWGLAREPAWAAATFYAFSGFALSQMSYYNLIAGATLVPFLVAAGLLLGRRPTPKRLFLAAGAWALVLLSGDPTVALLAAVATVTAWVFDGFGHRRLRAGLGLAAAGVGGFLLTLPQWVEFWRILPTSFRSVQGYSESMVGRFEWSHLADWLLPTVFGRVDWVGRGGFWAQEFFGGSLPFFLALAPGYLVLMLWCVGPRRDRGVAWGGACFGVGVALSFGWLDGAFAILWPFEGGRLLRFPVKSWLLVALGGSLLAGSAWDRLLSGSAKARVWLRRAGVAGVALASVAAGIGFVLKTNPEAIDLGSLTGLQGDVLAAESSRWIGLALAGTLLALVLVAQVVALPRFPELVGPLLLLTFALSQLAFLGSVLARDGVQHYALPTVDSPSALDWLPPGTRSVHAGVSRLPEWTIAGSQIEGSAAQLARRAATQLYPFVGVAAGVRYELNPSPEGLDSYLTYLALDATRRVPLAARVRLLRTWGVEALISRPGLHAEGLVESWVPADTSLETVGYRIQHSVPEIRLVRGVLPASSPGEALASLLSDGFDPMLGTVVVGAGMSVAAGREDFEVEKLTDREIVVRTQAMGPAYLVVQRTYQPVYRATVDGVAARVEVADLHRLAVLVPAGAQRVRLWVDESPRVRAWWGSLVGLLFLVLVASRLARRGVADPAAVV